MRGSGRKRANGGNQMIRKLMLSAAIGLLAMPAAAADYDVLMKTLANPFWGAMELV